MEPVLTLSRTKTDRLKNPTLSPPDWTIPGIGPIHANLAAQRRATVLAVNDDEAIEAAYELTKLEGIIPALESAHALGALKKLKFKPEDVVVLTVSGRGDKDIETYLSFNEK